MTTLVLRDNHSPAPAPSSISTPGARPVQGTDRSFEGVVLFSAIGFGLMMLAAVFQHLDLSPPVF